MKLNLGIVVTLALAIIGGVLELGAMRQQVKDDREALVELKAEVKELRLIQLSWTRGVMAEIERTRK
jgi:hypothetical protein